MHARNDDTTPVDGRHGDLWFGLAMLLLGLLVVCGAWREITHHDGSRLVVVPASMMPVLAALRSLRARRGTTQ
jgi:hypothetical protein